MTDFDIESPLHPKELWLLGWSHDHPPTRPIHADWAFTLSDLRDSDRKPIDPTGYTLKLQFRHAHLRGIIIDTLSDGAGLTLTAASDADHGPTVAVLSRACNRTWDALVDTPVIGDLMMFRGAAPDRDSVFLARIQFTATWTATQDA